MAKTNCWDFKKCGREPGGPKVTEFGICPVATAQEFKNINEGFCGGRFCWNVHGTLCDAKVSGDAEARITNCLLCDFFQAVRREEGTGFVQSPLQERITQPHKIAQLFKKIMDEEIVLEVHFDQKVRTFYAEVMDHLPALVEEFTQKLPMLELILWVK